MENETKDAFLVDAIIRIKSKVLNPAHQGEFAQQFLWALANELESSQGLFYIAEKRGDARFIGFAAGYAYHAPDSQYFDYEFGDGLAGQVAKDGKPLILDSVPQGYITILSGLGKASPSVLLIYPIKHEGEVLAIIELASFKQITSVELELLNELSEYCAQRLNALPQSPSSIKSS